MKALIGIAFITAWVATIGSFLIDWRIGVVVVCLRINNIINNFMFTAAVGQLHRNSDERRNS